MERRKCRSQGDKRSGETHKRKTMESYNSNEEEMEHRGENIQRRL